MLPIVNSIKKIMMREQPKVLGRWNIDYCNKKINNKIDLSNEDHCGPCGQYALDKITSNNSKPPAPASIIVPPLNTPPILLLPPPPSPPPPENKLLK